ncbi:MAG: hypothetical protein R3F14_22870 [Polyangiaceae bacterium]
MAGSKAFKAAAAQCQPVLLEPVVKLSVTTPQETTGDVIGDINSRRGRILGTDSIDDLTIVNANVPLSEVLEYESKLKSMTQARRPSRWPSRTSRSARRWCRTRSSRTAASSTLTTTSRAR